MKHLHDKDPDDTSGPTEEGCRPTQGVVRSVTDKNKLANKAKIG